MGQIYLFRAISSEEKAFLRDYEVDSEMSFLDFHVFIQSNLGYDTQQLASFFLADSRWERGLELTPIDMGNDAGPAAIPMDTVRIEDLLKQKKDRIVYVFDLLMIRALFMEVMAIAPPVKGKKYPFCSATIGSPPQQILNDPTLSFSGEEPFDTISNDIDMNDDDFTEDFFGEESDEYY